MMHGRKKHQITQERSCGLNA